MPLAHCRATSQAPARVLILDRLENEATRLASALRMGGFEVLVADSAAQARYLLSSAPVSVAIVDLMLPKDTGVHGLAFARELRESHATTRVVLTSRFHVTERQLERADCGASGFIPKPFELDAAVEFISGTASSEAPPTSRVMASYRPAATRR